MTTKSVNSLNY